MPDAAIAKKIRPSHIRRKMCRLGDITMGGRAIVEPEGVGKRFKSTFVGIEEDKYVILRAPSVRDHLHLEKPVTVRYLHKGQVRGFRSQIVGVITFPYPLIFLSYPSTLELLDLRRHERIDSFMPATVYYEGAEAKCLLLNISLSGCRLLMAFNDMDNMPELGQGAEIALRVGLMGSDDDAIFDGIVNNAPKDEDKLYLGVEFTDMTEELKEALELHTAYVKKAANE